MTDKNELPADFKDTDLLAIENHQGRVINQQIIAPLKKWKIHKRIYASEADYLARLRELAVYVPPEVTRHE